MTQQLWSKTVKIGHQQMNDLLSSEVGWRGHTCTFIFMSSNQTCMEEINVNKSDLHATTTGNVALFNDLKQSRCTAFLLFVHAKELMSWQKTWIFDTLTSMTNTVCVCVCENVNKHLAVSRKEKA